MLIGQPTIEKVSQEEFDQTLRRYISWVAEWEGSLPAAVFFGAWAALAQSETPVQLHARVVEKRLELSAPSESSIRTRHNRTYLEDGRELVIQLELIPNPAFETVEQARLFSQIVDSSGKIPRSRKSRDKR